MPPGAPPPSPRFRRIGADELHRMLGDSAPPLILDVRRGDAIDEAPGVPGAVPFVLDREPMRLPDTDHGRPIVTYCL